LADGDISKRYEKAYFSRYESNKSLTILTLNDGREEVMPRRPAKIKRGKGVASGVRMIFSGGKLFGATKSGKYYGSPLKIRRKK